MLFNPDILIKLLLLRDLAQSINTAIKKLVLD